MPADASHLRELPLFAGLSARQRDKLARHLRAVELAVGEHIVEEGASSYEFFVIVEGTAAVVSGTRHVADLGPGDFLGEIGLIRKSDRTASVIATSPLTALVMTAESFAEMTRSMPAVAREIEAAIEERLERNRLFGLRRD